MNKLSQIAKPTTRRFRNWTHVRPALKCLLIALCCLSKLEVGSRAQKSCSENRPTSLPRPLLEQTPRLNLEKSEENRPSRGAGHCLLASHKLFSNLPTSRHSSFLPLADNQAGWTPQTRGAEPASSPHRRCDPERGRLTALPHFRGCTPQM